MFRHRPTLGIHETQLYNFTRRKEIILEREGNQLTGKQFLFMSCLGKLLLWCEQNGYTVTGGDLYRSMDSLKCYHCQQPVNYQQLLVSNGRSHTLNSLHCNRLAIDLNLFKDGQYIGNDGQAYAPLGQYWESLDPSNHWGGGDHFPVGQKDFDHFETVII